MEYTLADLHEHAQDTFGVITWLNDENFLDIDEVRCATCHTVKHLVYCEEWSDGVALRCRRCKKRSSVRVGSFFEVSNYTIYQQMHLIIDFARGSSQVALAKGLGLSRGGVDHYFRLLRQRYQEDIQLHPVTFSENTIYECDEMTVKHVLVHPPDYRQMIWIASQVERSTGKCKLYRIPRRSIDHMIPPIAFGIPVGSIVCTEELKVYQRLNSTQYAYEHYSVNHSAGEYARMEEIPGYGQINVHINSCEGLHAYVRGKLRFFSRRTIETIDLYLSEIMFRRSNRSLFLPFKINQ